MAEPGRETRRDARRVWRARKSAAFLHRRLSQTLEVIRQLSTLNERDDGPELRKDTLYYIHDILDHIQDLEQRLQAVQEAMARSQANYFAKISIDVTRASNRMSVVMKQVRAPKQPAAAAASRPRAWWR